jgi:predicted ribosomally synthesized peptide with SipW-like signal peptide
MKKKSLGALVLSAALLISATASTFAYFTNTTQTDIVSFTTGNVKVQFLPKCETGWVYTGSTTGNSNNERDLSLKSNAKNLAPGDKIMKVFVLENNGSLDAKVRLSIKDMTATSETNVDNGWWCFHDYEVMKAYTIDADGNKIKDVDLKLQYDVDGKTVKYITLDASCNEKVAVELNVTLDPKMPNGAWVSSDTANGPYVYANFNKQFDLRILAEATQWNNPGFNEAGQ